ncbi:MAG: asparaginase, partial [Pseudomonadota bacterium]
MTDGACNPALITVARGAMTESGHRGAIAICDADGALAETVGDVDRPVFPRSAIKALQAIPLVATGAADAAGYSHCDIALACASHSGAAEHARTADGILGRVGLTDAALACGAHWPLGETENRDLARHNDEPRRVHNNCSGKHAGMLALAHHLNAPTAGYVHADHPVQRAILDVLARYSGEPLQDRHPATDGCGAPNWPITLTGLA